MKQESNKTKEKCQICNGILLREYIKQSHLFDRALSFEENDNKDDFPEMQLDTRQNVNEIATDKN